MRFLIDESAPRRFATLLTVEGHDVAVAGRDYPRQIPDEQVLAIAYEQGRVLLTNDTDFGELVVRDGLPHAGIILFRIRSRSFAIRSARLLQVLDEYSGQLGRFLTVTEDSVRLR